MEEIIKFIGDRYSVGLPYIEDVKFPESHETAIHWLKLTQRRDVWKKYWTNDFRKRWLREYLPTLQKRGKWKEKSENLAVGDIVKICADGMRSGDWPIGRIVELHPVEDGVLRIVTIRRCLDYYKRPVVKIAKIVLNDGFGESIGNTRGRMLKTNHSYCVFKKIKIHYVSK
jgi:hypothetical protein